VYNGQLREGGARCGQRRSLFRRLSRAQLVARFEEQEATAQRYRDQARDLETRLIEAEGLLSLFPPVLARDGQGPLGLPPRALRVPCALHVE